MKNDFINRLGRMLLDLNRKISIWKECQIAKQDENFDWEQLLYLVSKHERDK